MSPNDSNVVSLAGATLVASEDVTPFTREDTSLGAQDIQLIAIVILAVLAIFCALYVGRDLILPVVMATVLNLLLQPLNSFLSARLHVPLAIAALAIIISVFAAVVALGAVVSVASSGWAQHAPESFAVLKERLAFLSAPLSYAQGLLHSIESMSIDTGKANAPVAVTHADALPGLILFGTASTLRELLTTVLVLYFMLASGDRLLRGLIEVLPRFRDKRRAVEIAADIQSGIASYLVTITIMNAAVGIATGLVMWTCGLADPLLWGTLAFLLNFIPIIGPLVGIAVFFVAGLVSLPWPFPALVPVLAYFLIHLMEGQAVTPMLVSRRFELNPVLVILSLLFWHELWGVPGALLAVPLLASFKIFADRIEPLKPIGHLIGA